jgi:hypothetical protein
MGGACSARGQWDNACKIVVGNPEGKIVLGRPRRRRENNIKMDIKKIGAEDVNLINVAWDTEWRRAFVKTVMNVRFHKRLRISCLAKRTVSFSRQNLLYGVS